ncbi:hypothetical protein [Rouxiella sp. Mn2063]|uniref:hypothetical protein n=1 Tax=Rouxiella sp. Mn2063 TaxID=3395262 RepID=UPI003BEBBAB3
MARIRTVKPEIWTDEKVVECSIPARLLFIGMFNFADDNGNLVNSPKRIKMQIFPADVIDCEPLIKELITHGVLNEYSVSDISYLNIKGFNKHQKINRPSSSNIPKFEFSEHSVTTHVVLTDGKDTEGKGKEREEENNTQAAEAACPDAQQDNSSDDGNVHQMASKYAFEGNVIRLNQKDFDRWRALFRNIDLQSELMRIDIEFTNEKPKNWFNTLSAKLNYQNKQGGSQFARGNQRRVAGVSQPMDYIPEGFV